jgi:hypothetical protein
MKLRTFLLCVFVFLLPILAFAQALPPPIANNPNSAALVGWCAFGYMILGPLVSVFRPDNTFLPFSVSIKIRGWIMTGGGLIEAILLAVYGGQPWKLAILTGAVSAFTAFAGHGVRTLPGASAGEAFQQKSGRPPKSPTDTTPSPPTDAPPTEPEAPLPAPPAIPK